MLIGIHQIETGNFTQRWISYCIEKKYPYKIVNSYKNDIIEELRDCDIFLWHFHNNNYKDNLFAKQLLFSLNLSDILIFPDFPTSWHFDDKIAQKYLLENMNVPFANTYVFYSKDECLDWLKTTDFPKVFKLRGGAGSTNVRLIDSYSEAKKIVKQAFDKGFSAFDRKHILKESIRKYKNKNNSLQNVVKALVRYFIPHETTKMFKREKGYIYFQEFIPNNTFDIRVIVIDNKAFAIKRLVRPNDFRASGSGNILYDKENFNIDIIRLSFDVANKLKTQSVAFDYVFDHNQNPYIVEISYGFDAPGYDKCPGYWNNKLEWINGPFNPQSWIIDMLIRQYQDKNKI